MARRIRSIKPEFFENEQLAALPFEHRLLFAGLWTVADKAGRLEDRPTRLKARLLPYDEVDVDKMLAALAAGPDPFLVRYEAEGMRLIFILKFSTHQRPHNTEKESVLPPYISPDFKKKRRKSGNNSYSTVAERVPNGALTQDFGGVSHTPPQTAQTPPSQADKVRGGTTHVLNGNGNKRANNGYGTGTEPLHNGALTLGSGSGEDQDQDLVGPAQNAVPTPHTPSARGARGAAVARDERFTEFWSVYPRKVAKEAAAKAFTALAPDAELFAVILAAVNTQAQSIVWRKDGGQYVPHAASWLRGKRWLDEVVVEEPLDAGFHRVMAGLGRLVS